MKRILTALLMAGVALLTLTTATFAWQSRIEGKPASFEAGSTGGYYFWHDDDGLHVRTTDPEGIDSWYAGVVTTDGTFRDLDLVRAEPDDNATLEGPQTLVFGMHTFSGVDGFNFNVDGGTFVRLDLYRDGHQTSPDHIFLGAKSVHPNDDPFVIRR